jgi:hypothetical protein
MQSLGGAKNIFVAVDDHSRFVKTKFFAPKESEAVCKSLFELLKEFELDGQRKIKHIRMYNGNEFVNCNLQEYVEKNKINTILGP